jgi:hypothetical protein
MRDIANLKGQLNAIEATLVADIKAGREPQPEGETMLWALSFKLCCHHATFFCRGSDRISPDILATDVVTQMAGSYPTCLLGRHRGRYTTYLYAAVRHKYIDAVRALAVRRADQLDAEAEHTLPSALESPEHRAIRRQRFADLGDILRTATSTDRIFFLQVAGLIPLAAALEALGLKRSEYFRRRAELLKKLGRTGT